MTTTTITRGRSKNAHADDHSHENAHDHDHDNDHGHDHAHDHVGEHGGGKAQTAERRPTGEAVLFDIGDGIGALIVRLDDALAGTELPIEADDPAVNIHTGVWKRTVDGTEMVLAIYPELPEGRYSFTAGPNLVAGQIVIESGKIADLDLRT